MYINLMRDDDGLKFQLFDNHQELFYTSSAFENPDDCSKVLEKIKENDKYIEWIPILGSYY